jgi:hypothetical protein
MSKKETEGEVPGVVTPDGNEAAATEHDVAVQPNPNQPVLLEDECIPGVTRVYGKQYSVGASQAGMTGVILTLVTATGATVIEMRDKYIAHGKLCTR